MAMAATIVGTGLIVEPFWSCHSTFGWKGLECVVEGMAPRDTRVSGWVGVICILWFLSPANVHVHVRNYRFEATMIYFLQLCVTTFHAVGATTTTSILQRKIDYLGYPSSKHSAMNGPCCCCFFFFVGQVDMLRPLQLLPLVEVTCSFLPTDFAQLLL
jgi:hypothetical protein